MEDQPRMTRKTRYFAPLLLTTALILTGVVTTSARPAPQGDSDITRAELGRLDRFLDNHPEIAQQLEKNPSLIDNEQFVKSEPALQAFLQDHPEIREALQANPQAVLREAFGGPAPSPTPAPVITRQDTLTAVQAASLDDFLDAHPVIAKQLESNPSLINNKDFLADNPALSAFLQDHPDLAALWAKYPQVAMTELNRLETTDSKFTHSQMATLDEFLDNHPAIAKQLEANPLLIDNKDFVADHADLSAFLQSNPAVAEEWKTYPEAAMFDIMSSRTGSNTGITASEVKTFAGFLDEHPAIDAELNAHPNMIDDTAYVDSHPELQTFLRSDPEIATELRDNPQAFMNDVRRYDTHTGTSATAKPGSALRVSTVLHK
jgi:hypothetical protein